MLINGLTELIDIERLRKVHNRSKISSFFNHVQLPVSRHHDDFNRSVNALDVLQDIKTVHSGNLHIQKNKIGRHVSYDLKRQLTIGCLICLVPFTAEYLHQQYTDTILVINDEQFLLQVSTLPFSFSQCIWEIPS